MRAAAGGGSPYAGTETQLFLLGAAKSGTTSLAQWLDRHPDILLSDPKEPFFFELFYERGLQDYWDRCFAARWTGEPIVVDGRHRNLYLPFVSARIEASAPNPRFVVILREPVSRAFSQWWHWRSRGREALDFADAVAEDLARIDAGVDFSGPDGPAQWATNYPEVGPAYNGVETLKYRTYVDTGFYARQLDRYRERFGAERLMVLFTDELAHGQDATLRRLTDFLGVPPGTASDPAPFENVARRAPAPRPSPARALARRITPRRMRERVRRHLPLASTPPSIDDRTRRLLQDVYRPHNEELVALLARPLPDSWAP